MDDLGGGKKPLFLLQLPWITLDHILPMSGRWCRCKNALSTPSLWRQHASVDPGGLAFGFQPAVLLGGSPHLVSG